MSLGSKQTERTHTYMHYELMYFPVAIKSHTLFRLYLGKYDEPFFGPLDLVLKIIREKGIFGFNQKKKNHSFPSNCSSSAYLLTVVAG